MISVNFKVISLNSGGISVYFKVKSVRVKHLQNFVNVYTECNNETPPFKRIRLH